MGFLLRRARRPGKRKPDKRKPGKRKSVALGGPSAREACCASCPACFAGAAYRATTGQELPPDMAAAADVQAAEAPMEFDLAIVGAGSAGLSVAAAAAQLGARVALIERGRMGGDCLNTGCLPSKALLAAAHAARTIRDSARFGVFALDPIVDWDRLRAHVQGVIAEIAPADSEAR